jgi:hypothetical protein
MIENILKYKKAQVWSLDLLIAGIIFLIGVVILYNYAINYSSQSNSNLDELFYEGNLASDLILSGEDMGILSNNAINQSKLDAFYNLDDSTKKSNLGIKSNFYFTLENLEIEGTPTAYVGIMNSSQVDNLIQITRLTIYKNKPIKFQLFVWR